MAYLPVDLLIEPDQDARDGWLFAAPRDAVRPERIRHGALIVAGWGEHAWRTRLVVEGDRLAIHRRASEGDYLDNATAEWSARAHVVLARHLPDNVDEGTRAAVVKEILALPTRDFDHQERSVRLLLGAHRTLRRSARRVLLQSVARHHLAEPNVPHTSPPWQLLARLTRTPAARLAGETSRGVMIHDSRPQCPTARRFLDL